MNYSSIKDFTTALEALKLQFPQLVAPFVRTGIDVFTKAIVERNVTKGLNGDNTTYSPYSKKHVSKRKREGKAPFGTQSSRKNFYLTGGMWSTFGIRTFNVQADRILSQIDFAGSNLYLTNKDLAEIHGDNENKSITAISVKEEEEFVEKLSIDIINVIKQYI